MLNEKICNDAVGVISFIVEDSDYKNAIVTNTKSGESFDAIEVLENLIKEHFTPKALKFKELHKNMWVYDKKYKICRQVHKFYNNGSRDVIQFKSDHYPNLAEAYFFEKNRFYPIQIPMLGENQ